MVTPLLPWSVMEEVLEQLSQGVVGNGTLELRDQEKETKRKGGYQRAGLIPSNLPARFLIRWLMIPSEVEGEFTNDQPRTDWCEINPHFPIDFYPHLVL